MKRFVAIFMLLCANIMLFAHAVVKHHHHIGVVVVNGECVNVDIFHKHYHDIGGQAHSHNHHSGCEYCSSDIATHNIKEQWKVVDFEYIILRDVITPNLLIDENSVSCSCCRECYYCPPDIKYYHLRGPPVC